MQYLTDPYDEGESWADAVERVGWFLRDLRQSYDQQRVLVIGHVATRWGLQHHLEGRPLAELMTEDFAWQLGWEYQLTDQ
jgi:broad specificity phosphatase PhoE